MFNPLINPLGTANSNLSKQLNMSTCCHLAKKKKKMSIFFLITSLSLFQFSSCVALALVYLHEKMRENHFASNVTMDLLQINPLPKLHHSILYPFSSTFLAK